jgi:2-polyprenyl-3-methyl-5-hydroxy-6-metoxy-1,4-benzoquinol methylase
MNAEYSEFGFVSAKASHMHKHFMPTVLTLAGKLLPGARVLDVGCGNGLPVANFLRAVAKLSASTLAMRG